MHPVEIITLLLGVTTLLAVVARRIRIPYPILLVVTGLLIGWTPGLPPVQLDPDVVFLIFLPPLLFSAAWEISWRELKRVRRSVLLLATGLVAFTSSLVAILSCSLIPAFTLAQGFLLGSIISPPDAVAASSVTKGLNVPKRVSVVLEGERLVNDATSLIIYRYALASLTTGQFVLWEAGLQFILVAVVSVMIGLGVGFGVLLIHKLVRNDRLVNTAVTLLTPYSAYLLAEAFHFSGVLSVVTAGLYVSWRASEVFSHQTRLQAVSVWETVVFLLNGIIFILIGLQLPTIIDGLHDYTLGEAIGYAVVISAAAVLIRILWVFPGAYLPRFISRKVREQEPNPGWRQVTIVAWAGMRGVVSLAAALAIPNQLPNGQPFPGRDLILFVTFCVILCTLVVQGLSLPVLIRALGVQEPAEDRGLEQKLRLKMAQAAINHLEANHSLGSVSDEVLNHVKNTYELRINQLYGRFRTETPDENPVELYEQAVHLQLELLSVERSQLIGFRRYSQVSDEVIRKVEQELDLEAARLSL